MTYGEQITRDRPGCIVFLVDQSGSMAEPIVSGKEQTKAEAVAESINELLTEIIMKCIRVDMVRDYFHISVIGYRTDESGNKIVESVFTKEEKERYLIPISVLAENPVRFKKIVRTLTNLETGEPEEIEEEVPVWFEPVAMGQTPMIEAFKRAYQFLEKWTQEHQNSFPSIVINITDGRPTDGDDADLIAEAKKVMGTATTDGYTLLFNVFLPADSTRKIMFPSSIHELPDESAKVLFEASSVIPSPILNNLEWNTQVKLSPGARGLMYDVANPGIFLLYFFKRDCMPTGHYLEDR